MNFQVQPFSRLMSRSFSVRSSRFINMLPWALARHMEWQIRVQSDDSRRRVYDRLHLSSTLLTLCAATLAASGNLAFRGGMRQNIVRIAVTCTELPSHVAEYRSCS